MDKELKRLQLAGADQKVLMVVLPAAVRARGRDALAVDEVAARRVESKSDGRETLASWRDRGRTRAQGQLLESTGEQLCVIRTEHGNSSCRMAQAANQSY